ncbi:MAG TPA: signal peptidase II [Usitatibacteraceae bacterium]
MPSQRSRFGWLRWLALSMLVIVLDQISKNLIVANFQYGESKYLLPFFNLVLAYNKGAAFSFLANASGWQREFFIAVTVVITAVLLWMMKHNQRNVLLCAALALVIGGAFGNLHDRVMYGHVIDFIQWHVAGVYWPAFNIADSAICLGAGLLIWDSFRKPKADPAKKEAA